MPDTRVFLQIVRRRLWSHTTTLSLRNINPMFEGSNISVNFFGSPSIGTLYIVEVGRYLKGIVDGAKLDTVLDLARFLNLQPVFLILLHTSFFKAAESIFW